MIFINSKEQSVLVSEGRDQIGYFYKFGPFSSKKEAKDFIYMIVNNHGNEILGQEIYRLKPNHLMPVVTTKALYVKVYVK